MAPTLATTKMSSRGQVVIPLAIRDKMGLKNGAEFVVISEGDSLMLKLITPPSLEEFRSLQKRISAEAKKTGMKPGDIKDAIRRVRGRK